MVRLRGPLVTCKPSAEDFSQWIQDSLAGDSTLASCCFCQVAYPPPATSKEGRSTCGKAIPLVPGLGLDEANGELLGCHCITVRQSAEHNVRANG